MMSRRNFLAVAAALGAGALLGGCAGGEDDAAPTTGAPVGAPMEEDAMAGERTITVACGEAVVTYELNDSAASEGLLAQLPLALEVEDFSDNEKVFYPPEELDVTDAPLAETGEAGTLAYYAPWGDVVMFYGSFSPNGALYELGRAVDGMDAIAGLSGAIEVSSAGSATSAATVYFTRDISPEGLLSVWHALGATPSGNVAVKLSTGEPGGRNFLSPGLIADLVHEVGGTIVECNTAYGGQRGSTESHLRAAADHGFTAIADVDIMDADGSASLPVAGGEHLSEDLVGAHLADYDYVLSLAHFKGHAMGGFGGAVKNCSIGIASREGKMLIHSAGASTTGWGSPAQDDFLESMAEAAKAVSDHFGGVGGNMAYVNVMNRLSVDCDCDSNPAEPDMADIGILASLDPVALDRACVDLVYAADDGASLVERMESRNGAHTLEHAEAIGLGSQSYELVEL